MSELFEIVRERPIQEKPSGKASCPTCNGNHLRGGDYRTTLIGGGDGTHDGDPNHRHYDFTCNDCGSRFMRETKSGNVWYTALDGRVLRGMPSCFELYAYGCKDCGGEVRRRYTQLDGVTPATLLGYNPQTGERSHRTFFDCAKCGKSTETRDEYWRGQP